MFIKCLTLEQATEWITHNDLLVGYDGEGKTKTLANPIEGVDGWFISLAKERWNGEELAEPLELLDGVIVGEFERELESE